VTDEEFAVLLELSLHARSQEQCRPGIGIGSACPCSDRTACGEGCQTVKVTWANDDATLASEANSTLEGTIEQVEELPHATRNTATSRVIRVRTHSRSGIAKFISSGGQDPAWGGSRDPNHLRYWRREADLYETGIPEVFAEAGVQAPALLASFERPSGVVLWLEDLGGRSGAQLGLEDLANAGRRLGRAQAPYALGQTPDGQFPWSTGAVFSQLQSWENVGWEVVYDDKAWQQPLMSHHISPSLRDALVLFSEQRWELLGLSRHLPQTLCHHDAWLNNIFAYSDHTTLIDWAFVGYGHLGCDPGNMVTDACGDLLLPSSLLPEIDAVVTDGYLKGLQDGGWTGDPRAVRLGICLMAAKWSWLIPHQLQRAVLDGHRVYGGGSVDSEHLFAERAAMLEYLSAMAAEAQQLAVQLAM
jgi:hypothetical protein